MRKVILNLRFFPEYFKKNNVLRCIYTISIVSSLFVHEITSEYINIIQILDLVIIFQFSAVAVLLNRDHYYYHHV